MRRIITFSIVLVSLVSCGFVGSILHDEQVVAKVGQSRLYLSELEKYIPNNISSEDSLKLAAQFIDVWSRDQLFLKVAQEQLSAEEMDVTAELEDYRRSLIKYRYEQRYINDRLDTLVTDDQVAEYYNAHLSDFVLEQPIMKARLVDVMKDSPNRDEIIASLRADTLSHSSALRWFDGSDRWIDASELAAEFGVDTQFMLSQLKNEYIRIEPKDRGDLLVAYVLDIVYGGQAPVEYCREQIRDKILNIRKHELAAGLEQDLLEDAKARGLVEIYER